MSAAGQQSIDRRNAEFWQELCGTSMASALGITDLSQESLRRFDDAYFAFYPYLLEHVRPARMKGRRVLEVGLGFGTLGQRIAEEGAEYLGMDVARKPVDMMRHRLELVAPSGRCLHGSFLDNRLHDESFDHVVSIGCFHHTGDVQRCILETHRLLKPGGTCVVMVYNRYSLRQWLRWPFRTFRALFGHGIGASETQRGAYDADSEGQAAPVTEFFSVTDLKQLFGDFSRFRARRENFDDFRIRGIRLLPRRLLLRTLGPLVGLDVYVEARK